MSGIGWHIFAFSAIGIFLIVIVYRTIAIIRLPIHLRWELAPIPHEKGKNRYGGSYLEEHEWWQKAQQKTSIAPIVYMAKEIFLFRGVWQHNKLLWLFSLSMHLGIYLIILMFLLMLVNALLINYQASSSALDAFKGITNVVSFCGYLLGRTGALGLIVMRIFYADLRSFSTTATYFRLLFLAAVFISGALARAGSGDFTYEMSMFIKGLITLDSNITVSVTLAVHIIISLLFLMYLPMTDMIHFIAKYFTYHDVRWNDEPVNEKMEKEVRSLLKQPVRWAADHVKADGRKTWEEVTTEEVSDDEKPQVD